MGKINAILPRTGSVGDGRSAVVTMPDGYPDDSALPERCCLVLGRIVQRLVSVVGILDADIADPLTPGFTVEFRKWLQTCMRHLRMEA